MQHESSKERIIALIDADQSMLATFEDNVSAGALCSEVQCSAVRTGWIACNSSSGSAAPLLHGSCAAAAAAAKVDAEPSMLATFEDDLSVEGMHSAFVA